jgi:hypothetical protein
MSDKIPGSPRKCIVLTGDLRSSRKQQDRARMQEGLKSALAIINNTFSPAIRARFVIVGGDGFQGMLLSLERFFDIYYKLIESIGHQFCMGVGIGDISTRFSKDVSQMDGEVFHRSSESLNRAKKQRSWIGFASGAMADAVVTSCLNLMADVIWNWSSKQREVALYYRTHGENRQAVRLAAETLGVGERSIYKTLRTGKYALLNRAENALVDTLNQIWFNLSIEPINGQ